MLTIFIYNVKLNQMEYVNNQQPDFQPTQQIIQPETTFPWVKVILFVILLVIPIGIGGYILGTKKNQPVQQQETKIPPTIYHPSPTPNQTTNWKIYINKSDHYSLKYPPSWSVEEVSNSATFYPSRIPANILKQEEKESPLIQEPHISIYVISTPFKESLALTGKIFIIEPMAIDVDGKRGYYYQSLCAPSCGINVDLPYDNGSKILQLYLDSIGKDIIDRINKTYRINLQDADEKTFKEILSTFKFLDQTQKIINVGQMIGKFYWDVSNNFLSKEIEEEIKTTFASFDPKIIFQDGQHLAVIGINISKTSPIWATAGIQLLDKENNLVPTDGLEYLLDKRQGRWVITMPSDKNFCKVLEAAPDDVISKDYYSECK